MSDEFLSRVNKIILSEHGNQVSFDDVLNKSGLDSFSWVVFWLELDKYYPLKFPQEYIDELDYNKVSFADIAKKAQD